MPPVSVCQPVVVDGQAQRLPAPRDGCGVERLAHAGHEAQVRIGAAPRLRHAGLHQHADCRRCRVPDADAFLLEQAVPPLGIEFLDIDQRSHAQQQRSDDAVRGSGHPAGIGGAPEAILGMEVERVARGCVMRDHRAMHVLRALRRAGGTAGEVQQCGVLGRGRRGFERVGGGGEERAEVECAGLGGGAAIRRDQQHVPQRRQLCTPLLHLAPVKLVGGHEHLAFAHADARGDRLRAESREERRHHGAVLQCAEHRDIEFGNAPGEHEHAIALADAELAQHIGKAVRPACEFAIAQVQRRCVARDEAQGRPVLQWARRMPVDGLEAHVESATGKALEGGACRIPAEGTAFALVVHQVRQQTTIPGSLADKGGFFHGVS